MVKGIVRSIDELGRLVISKEIRRSLNIGMNDPLDIYLEGNTICVTPLKLQCVICGSVEEENLLEVQGVHICRECAGKLVKKNE